LIRAIGGWGTLYARDRGLVKAVDVPAGVGVRAKVEFPPVCDLKVPPKYRKGPWKYLKRVLCCMMNEMP